MFTLAAIPDGGGDFMISKVSAGRYQLTINLPSRDWYVSSLTQLGAGEKPKPIEGEVTLKQGENLTGLSISVRHGAAAGPAINQKHRRPREIAKGIQGSRI